MEGSARQYSFALQSLKDWSLQEDLRASERTSCLKRPGTLNLLSEQTQCKESCTALSWH